MADDTDALFAEFLGEIESAEKAAPPAPEAEIITVEEKKRPAETAAECADAAAPVAKRAKTSTVAARAKPVVTSSKQPIGPALPASIAAVTAVATSPPPPPPIRDIGVAAGPSIGPYAGPPPPRQPAAAAAAAAAALPAHMQQPMLTPYQQQQSVYQYVPGAAPGTMAAAAAAAKPKTFVRVGGGQVWKDATLAEWPEDDFRLFVGDIGNEVSDAELAAAFAGYASFQRAKIIRDKHTSKSKGFGFVSFLDGFDMMKALREQQGKYLGNRPMKITKSTWKDRNIQQVRKKERHNKKEKKALGLL